jgi:sucrose-6-phosphate hydrolase SacC (GH32 family)
MFAAKSGTVEQQTGTTRRVLFAFPGWTQTTKPKGAPKCLHLPRDLTLGVDGQMRIAPIPELASLRQQAGGSDGGGSGRSSDGKLAGGTQLEVRLRCGSAAVAAAAASGGEVGVDVLASANNTWHTRVTYDHARQLLVVDQRASCGGSAGIVQTGPATLGHGEPVELVVFLDGYMLEVFLNNRTAITALVPACAFPLGATFQAALVGVVGGGGSCSAESWRLAL